MAGLTKNQAAAVEREALRLYDRYNPDSERVINVGKSECIKEARRKLFGRSDWRRKRRLRED